MVSEDLQRQLELFDAALSLPAGDREAFIAERCAAAPELGSKLRELLDVHEASPPQTAGVGLRPGTAVGAYVVLRHLAHGGMGSVFEAEQRRPRRRVALKVLRGDVATPAMRARFEQEAEVLGRLSHPGIARIHDAGSVAVDGVDRPYLAMEVIDGLPVTEFARRRALGVAERVDLLARTCDVVSHAHQTGVIHRDLKPSNVFVDSRGEPRLLDFGIARLVDGVSGRSLTCTGEVFGTLPYMSPEQVADAGTADERTDVYALGVLCYELLAAAFRSTSTGRACLGPRRRSPSGSRRSSVGSTAGCAAISRRSSRPRSPRTRATATRRRAIWPTTCAGSFVGSRCGRGRRVLCTTSASSRAAIARSSLPPWRSCSRWWAG